jgi:hypothetical protein
VTLLTPRPPIKTGLKNLKPGVTFTFFEEIKVR